MTDGLALIEPHLGATFAIPPDDWRATNNFCWATMYLKPDPDSPTGLPGTPAPVSQECSAACAAWIEGDYDDLVNAAGTLATVCGSNVQSLTSLKQIVDQLDPSSPLSPAQQSQATALLDGFAKAAGQQATIFGALGPKAVHLADLIAEFEQAVLAWMPDWFPTQPTPANLKETTTLLLGGWNAMTDDLSALSLPPDQVTTAFLLSLELESGILGWSNLETEAATFSSTAPSLGERVSLSEMSDQ